jgi:hypothetical protein
LGVSEIAAQVEGLIRALDLAAGVTPRARGLHGFECGVTYAAGILLDWTPADGEGPNKGYASAQLKGEFFKTLSPEESAFGLTWLAECLPYRCTRIDIQMTNCETPAVPQIIKGFREGDLRVKQKTFFEPKGLELKNGLYPKGATLCHGTRSSDNYARQYDKHLQEEVVLKNPEPGPPRRRDEIELKAPLAQGVWDDLVSEIRNAALSPQPDWEAEARFVQGRIRHLLPIRDVSQWRDTEMPKNWASTAPEPLWWAELFSEDAVRARREKGLSKPFLARVEYPAKNYGGRFLQDLVLERLKAERIFDGEPGAEMLALLTVRDKYVASASEKYLDELLEQLPESEHDAARAHWWGYVRAQGDGKDAEREWAESDFPRM